MQPTLTVIPARALSAEPQTTDLLVRITPPQTGGRVPPLDLVLALDTSGSMGGLPLTLACQAAAQVFCQRGDARLGLVTFASHAQVAAPLQSWEGESGFLGALDRLRAAGSTALHAGWQLAESMLTAPLMQEPPLSHRLQRVLLLPDGRANVGLKTPQDLAAAVRAGLAEGVGTSTVGVGRHYDEQLLETLAGEGDGTYHYAETPQDLEGLFLAELGNLRNTFGRLVSLGTDGVELLDILNDLPRLPNGRTALPPLQGGTPTELLLRVRAKAGDTVRLRLAWTDSSGQQCTLEAEEILPHLSGSGTPAEQPEVTALRARLELARTQRRVAELVDRGHLLEARSRLSEARRRTVELRTRGISVGVDDAQLERLEASLRRGDRQVTSKLARSEAYLSSSGRKKA
ncbi:MAG: VWA domain-containing protein [Deinococcus sp.]|nr:VWA domain-containing protein [Deinococcus sp.]